MVILDAVGEHAAQGFAFHFQGCALSVASFVGPEDGSAAFPMGFSRAALAGAACSFLAERFCAATAHLFARFGFGVPLALGVHAGYSDLVYERGVVIGVAPRVV